MSTTRRWQAAAAINESVDLPTPGMPTSTIDARESNMRRLSVGGDGVAGVIARDRGDDRALEGAESSSRIVAKVRFVPMVAAGIAD
jgi:hypothetical protein